MNVRKVSRNSMFYPVTLNQFRHFLHFFPYCFKRKKKSPTVNPISQDEVMRHQYDTFKCCVVKKRNVDSKRKERMQQNNPTEHFMARCPRGQTASVRGRGGQVDSIDNR